ncbi:MAG TPA: DUF2505 family protein [Kofleriaceae bacterium]
MSTEFSYETVFDASGKLAVLEAYFNEDHLATQDAVAGLCDRTIVESYEDDAIRKCTWSVRAQRQLPVFVRPFVDGGRLTYLEAMTWRKADDELDETIVPQIIGGRVKLTLLYQLADIGPRKVRRRYSGSIAVNLSLLSGKIERAILAEVEKGMPLMTTCTQDWLVRAGI